MGFHQRDYYHDSYHRWGLDRWTPVVKFVIIANVVVYLLLIFVTREVRVSSLELMRKQFPELDRKLTEAEQEGPEALEALKKQHPEVEHLLKQEEYNNLFAPTERVSVLQEWFELDTRKVVEGGQVWRLLTHAFCHDRWSILHILLNMFLLYWFGTTLEKMYGSREFVLFYLTAAVFSALAFMGLDLYTKSTIPAIGASGAVIAVMMLYTMHFPRETICICWVFPVEMRWVMLLYLIWDLHPVLLALAGDRYNSGVAHAGHLGGLAFGFLYARYAWRLEPILDWLSFWKRGLPRRRPRLRVVPSIAPEPRPDPEMNRLDELLQKIYESGQASLTEEERARLRQASDRLKNQGHGNG